MELAGIPILIRCRFEKNRLFFRDYMSEKEPHFSIQPTDDDIERIGSDFARMDEAEGVSNVIRSDVLFENNAIHALIAENLASRNVLLMHGSAISADGEAVIFTAKSGTGKSTHSRIWREVFGDRVFMINDDKPLLRIEEGEVAVWGSPWDGKHRLSRNISSPLKAIVSLERDVNNSIVPMGRTEALTVLMGHSYRSDNASTMTRIIELESRVIRSADFFLLKCNMDPEAARVARDGIFGAGK